MPLMEWSDKLQLKVDAMDKEHQVLLGHMNALFDANEKKVAKAEIESLFKKFMDYTVKHFKDEEAYMESIKWVDLQRHKVIHDELLKTVSTHFDNFKKGAKPTLEPAVFEFMTYWLRSHIMGIDMKYANSTRK